MIRSTKWELDTCGCVITIKGLPDPTNLGFFLEEGLTFKYVKACTRHLSSSFSACEVALEQMATNKAKTLIREDYLDLETGVPYCKVRAQ